MAENLDYNHEGPSLGSQMQERIPSTPEGSKWINYHHYLECWRSSKPCGHWRGDELEDYAARGSGDIHELITMFGIAQDASQPTITVADVEADTRQESSLRPFNFIHLLEKRPQPLMRRIPWHLIFFASSQVTMAGR